MEIQEVFANKKDYLDLMLLADEQEDMIDRYLDAGRMFRLLDNGVKCIAVVIEFSATECELKNIATDPNGQGKGYGQAMVEYLLNLFLAKYKTMYVGTGDVPKALRFYKKCGFRQSHRVANFFTDNYDKPIIEDGIQLRDMVYLRADAKQGVLITGDLADNIDKLHTTHMGAERIKRNLGLETDDIVSWCKDAVQCADIIIGQGKNYYVYGNGIVITVNAHNFCIITAHKIKAKIRTMVEFDYAVLNEFLYQAIFIPKGVESPPREILFDKKIYVYIDKFGTQAGDLGVVAEQNGQIVGAAWTRIIPAYGHLDNNTPELAISILPEFRGYGVGTKLMKKLFALLKQDGYSRTSLSVQKDNPAVRFYKRLGYTILCERPDGAGHEDYLMVKDLMQNESDKITLRPLCGEDIKLMERWLYLPHVAKWYKHPDHWLREIKERHGEFSFLTHFIAEQEGKPIGFCQYYDCYFAKAHEVWNDEWRVGDRPGEIYSLDILIGEPEYLKRGFAKQMVTKMIERVWRLGANKIIVEPEKDNAASNRLLQACGFKLEGGVYVLERWEECNV